MVLRISPSDERQMIHQGLVPGVFVQALLRRQAVCLVTFQGSNLIRKLLLRPLREVLNVVVEVIGRGQGLAAYGCLQATD